MDPWGGPNTTCVALTKSRRKREFTDYPRLSKNSLNNLARLHFYTPVRPRWYVAFTIQHNSVCTKLKLIRLSQPVSKNGRNLNLYNVTYGLNGWYVSNRKVDFMPDSRRSETRQLTGYRL